MNKETEEKVNSLSVMEQNLQTLSNQRRNFQNQLIELESAIEELKTSGESYKIIGNIMVKADKSSLSEELDSKKQVVEVRIKSIEKQEMSVKERAKQLQSEIMDALDDSKKGGKSE